MVLDIKTYDKSWAILMYNVLRLSVGKTASWGVELSLREILK